MHSAYYTPPSAITRHPVQATLVTFPLVCFTLALLTDIVFWRTSYLMWQHFSEWLLFAGLVFGGLAGLAGLAALLFRSREHERGTVWPYAIGGLVVLGLALLNSLVHAGDGWTAVVPYGLVLSALTFVVMIVTAWFSRSMIVGREGGER